MHRRHHVTAKEKLNVAHYLGSAIWAGTAGLLTQSLIVAALVFGALVVLKIADGEIR
ncbi:MAG TPA: hypothetical protein VGE52_06780 [Pirellulales bacterium]